MNRHNVGALTMLLGAGLAVGANRAHADQVLTAELQPAASGGMHATLSQKIALSPSRPAHVTKEPVYRNPPQYGMIKLGDAKDNQIVVVVDALPNGARPHLYVDANGNGDLTDDPPVTLTPSEGLRASRSPERLNAVVNVAVHYNIPGRAGLVQSALLFTWMGNSLSVNREYSRLGTLKIRNHDYRIALIDQNVDGRFNQFKHDEGDPVRVTLLIDRNNDGVFNPVTEAFDAAKPFKLGSGTYEITSIDARGTRIALQRSDKKVADTMTAADLRVGGLPLDFETETTDGKSVSFPDDYAKKVVLLDFWATWCPPCLEEIPNIVAVYNQYHEKGFEILGVSLDQPKMKEKLADFTIQHMMPWKQIYDGGYWKAEIATLYGVNAIPHALLVDGDTGKILAMGDSLRGEGLTQAVEKALANRKP